MAETSSPPESGLLSSVARVAELASQALLVLGCVAVMLLMLHVCADVAGKYFFNRPIVGTLEIVSRYYMVACVFLPLAYVQVHRQHLAVEMFTMGLSKRRLAGLDGVVSLAGLAYVVLLSWLVLGKAQAATRDNEILSLTYFDFPAWPARWILPVSFGLFAVVLLNQAIIDLRYAMTGRGQPTIDRKDDGVVAE